MAWFFLYVIMIFPSMFLFCNLKVMEKDTNNSIFWSAIFWPITAIILVAAEIYVTYKSIAPLDKLITKWRDRQ